MKRIVSILSLVLLFSMAGGHTFAQSSVIPPQQEVRETSTQIVQAAFEEAESIFYPDLRMTAEQMTWVYFRLGQGRVVKLNSSGNYRVELGGCITVVLIDDTF